MEQAEAVAVVFEPKSQQERTYSHAQHAHTSRLGGVVSLAEQADATQTWVLEFSREFQQTKFASRFYIRPQC